MTKGRLDAGARIALIGRHRELEAIDDAIESAAGGQGTAVLISGEAGIGKTSLAEETARRATEKGFDVLYGSSYPMDAGVAYAPIVAALGPFLAGLQPPARAKLTRGLEALSLLFEGLDLPPPPDLGDPALEKSRLFQSVLLLLQRLTGTQPRALVLDDLHWADPASVEMVSYMVRELLQLPLLLLVTYRAEDLPEGSGVRSLVSALRRVGRTTELRLGPLNPDQIGAMAEAILGEVPPGLDELLVERAGGTPLFVWAILQNLIDTGGLVQRGGRWFLISGHASGVPVVVQDLFSARLARLTETERRAVDALAVAGDAVPFDLLCSVTGTDESSLSRHLGRLSTLGLIREGASGGRISYRLSHPLIREVAYRELTALQRNRLHARFATVLEGVSPDWEALAFHYRQAGEAVDQHRRLEVLMEAGRRELRRYANEDAARNLKAALEAARQSNQRKHLPQILEDLGEAWQRLGEEQAAIGVWEEALDGHIAAGDGEATARLHLRLALAESDLGRFATAAERVKAGVGALPQPSRIEDQLDLLAVGVLNDFRRADLESARAGLEEITSLAAQADSAPAKLRAHMLRVGSHLEDTAYKQAQADALQALDLARRLQDPVSEQQALAFLALIDLSLGNLENLRGHLRANVELTTRTGITTREYRIRLYQFLGAFYAGLWDEAADIAVEAELWAEQIEIPRNRGVVDSMTALVDVHRGRFDHANRRLQEVRRALSGGPAPERPVTVLLDLLEAFSALEQDRPGLALDLVGAHDGYFLLPLLPPWGLMITGEAQARIGGAGVSDIVTQLAAISPRPSLPSAWSARIQGLAAADRGDEAAEFLTKAAEDFELLGMPFEASRARLEASEASPGGGDVPERLITCHRVFSDLGASRYVNRTARLLRSLGAPLPGAKRPSGGELTPRQIEVARLVAEGMSNAEIAERLYISLRTVTTHLEHIYAQLGFSSRTLLTRYVVENGLLDRPMSTDR